MLYHYQMTPLPQVNQPAPKFRAIDVLGNKVNVTGSGDGYLLITFLRYSGCPWCNLAIHRLALEYPQLKANNCQIIAFVQSEKDSVMKNIYERHDLQPQFPIIADHDMKYYKLYNVDSSIPGTLKSVTKIPIWLESVRKHGFKQQKLDGNFFLVPAWFLVNLRTGKIVQGERGVSFYNHESFIKIYDSLTFKD